jgi:D-arabinose 1-dehydrogenase-like Zn-dependent alcohol dehydrogenase
MKAAVFDGHCGVRIVDCPIPEIGMNEALVKVKYVGICGSDITIYMGKNYRAKIPVIPGHEIVGEIVDICANRSISSGSRRMEDLLNMLKFRQLI